MRLSLDTKVIRVWSKVVVFG